MIPEDGELMEAAFNDYKEKFMNSLKDDINTANAITVVYDVLKDDSLNGKTKTELLRSFDKVLSLDLVTEKHDVIHPQDEEIKKLIEQRAEYKKNHMFQEADGIRNELAEKGIELIDTREGTIYKIK